MNEFKIYTDGSCLGNPGAGGYAAVIIDKNGNLQEFFGGEPETTNNRMELMAAIVALKKVSPEDYVELFTDSSYLKNAFTQGWLANWKRNGWKTANKTPVLNMDLWKKLDALILNRSIKFNWVKGHAGNTFNERCDTLARAEAERQKLKPTLKIKIEQPKLATEIKSKPEQLHLF